MASGTTDARATPLRIAIVHTHPVQYLSPLFQSYAKDPSLEVHVFYSSSRGAESAFDEGFGIEVKWDVPLLDGYRSSISRAQESGWRRPISRLRRTLAWSLFAEPFDVVVAYGYNHLGAVVSLAVARLKRAKWVLVTDSHTLWSATGQVRPGKRAALHALGWIADGIMAQSRRSVSFYERFAPNKVYLLPHAIEERRYAEADSDQARDTFRLRRGAAADDVVLLFVGKLNKNKRVSDLILAAKREPSVRLWIVGSGPERGTLADMADSIGGRVEFFGFVNQAALPEVYAAADVIVLPSQHETFGLVVSEGASVGKPAIVSSSCGVVDSLVFDNETGRVFEPGDIDGLTDAIRELSKPEVRDRMSAAMTRVFREWTTEANVQAFVANCKRIANVPEG